MKPACLILALGLAAIAARAPAAAAAPHPDEGVALADYVQARAASGFGSFDLAARGYAAALAAAPDEDMLALRTFRQAVAAGDEPLALDAAHRLDRIGKLPPDGTLLLIADAVAKRDWKAADALVTRVEREDVFGFAAPVMRAWIAFGSHRGDPLKLLDAGGGATRVVAYAAEQRAFLLLALKHGDEGIAAIRALLRPNDARSTRLKLAAAARLVELHKRDAAMAMLAGDGEALADARALVAAKQPLPGAIDSAATGLAELFVRLGADVNRERPTPLALTLARLSTFLAPANAETWLVTSTLLASSEDYRPALAAIGHVAPTDPFAGPARGLTIELMLALGEQQQALQVALAATQRPGAQIDDWQRVGALYSDLDRHQDAAAAFAHAIALAEAKGGGAAPWSLWFQRGDALMQAGDWPGARAALEKAYALAPQEPEVLNYLGYAELSHGEDVANATALIQQAAKLKPNDPAIVDSLGYAYYVKGDLAQAITAFERAVAGAPGSPEINEHLGDAYWRTGRHIEARYAWRAALVTADDALAATLKAKIAGGLSAKP